jgi:hypothetical protein
MLAPSAHLGTTQRAARCTTLAPSPLAIELVRLCLKQAAATSIPAAAVQLRRMPSEYDARADALDEAPTPDTVAIPQSSTQGRPTEPTAAATAARRPR